MRGFSILLIATVLCGVLSTRAHGAGRSQLDGGHSSSSWQKQHRFSRTLLQAPADADNSSHSHINNSHAGNKIHVRHPHRSPNATAAEEEPDPTARSSWDQEPSYASHYTSNAERPNHCQIAHSMPAAFGRTPFNFSRANATDYVPFVGTSVVRDSQLLLLRLYHSLDFPVKHFVVVVGRDVANGRNVIAYELKHMLEYPMDNVGLVIITCEHPPSVSESWNAVFQTFKQEPWGVYMSRDTYFEDGSLAKLSRHGWEAAQTASVDVGFVKWSNMGEREAIHNTFMMTSSAVKRFGLWDENIFPAFCEDIDMMRRVKVMEPPLKEHQYQDVRAVHGKRNDTGYQSGISLPDDQHAEEEKALSHLTTHVRNSGNCNYMLRKWGCPSEHTYWLGSLDDCRFKTPFNRTGVPVWYWHHSKALRHRDRWIAVRPGGDTGLQLVDSKTNTAVFSIPRHYGTGWGGYYEESGLCRLSGFLGRITGPDGRPMCI